MIRNTCPRPTPLFALLLGLIGTGCTGAVGSPSGTGSVGTTPTGTPPAAAAGAGGTAPGPATSEACAQPPARIWKLTPGQLARAAKAVVPALELVTAPLASTLTRNAAFFSNAAHLKDMSTPHVQELMALASAFAAGAGKQAALDAPCMAVDAVDAACLNSYVAGFGERAFRRPLSPDELATFTKYYADEASIDGKIVALSQLARAVFLSPHFLYRAELGAAAETGPVVSMTPYERASALAFFVSDGPPDGELYGAAKAGALESSEQIAAQTRRLLSAPETAAGLLSFMSEQIRLEKAANLQKDAAQFPKWSQQTPADMSAETLTFIQNVLWNDDSSLRTLFTAKYSFVNARLAELYGFPPVAGDALQRVTLPEGRAGLLMQGSLLATLATPSNTHVIHRGRFVRENLLCQPLPPPPINFTPIPPPPDGVNTQRERLAVHSQDQTCAACHALMDPLGFGLEHFDAVGAYRSEEVGKPIDSSGYMQGVTAVSTTFQNALEMTELLGSVPELRDCFAGRAFAYANGRDAADGDTCAMTPLREQFRQGGGDIKELVVKLTTSETFLTRKK